MTQDDYREYSEVMMDKDKRDSDYYWLRHPLRLKLLVARDVKWKKYFKKMSQLFQSRRMYTKQMKEDFSREANRLRNLAGESEIQEGGMRLDLKPPEYRLQLYEMAAQFNRN